jgi:translocator protein
MNKDRFRQLCVVFATLVMISVNALANIIPFNGLTTGAISDQFKVFFVPDGYVFSIWGLIYIALIAYSVYQALPAQRENSFLRKIGWWYVAGCAANSVWIFLWHYQIFPLTLVMMVFLLVSLIVIYSKLNIGVEKVSRGMRYLVHLPFSIYLGWITVATIANVTDVLKAADWHGFGISSSMWAVVMLVVGVVIAEMVAYNRRDLAFLAVLVWAYFGIGYKFIGVSPIYEASIAAAIVIIVMMVLSILFKPKHIS